MFNIMNFLGIKDRLKSLYIVEFALILIGIIIRLKWYIINQSFFCDECSLGFNIVTRNYLELFLPLNVSQCAPPFFLVISKFILDMSHQYGNLYTQDLTLRLFPLICSIISLPLFAIFLNKITNNKMYIWICLAILSLNHCAIEYSVVFKQYSCELMFALILLLTFFHFDINKLTKKNSIIYSIIFCISIWFSSTAIILLATGLLYLIFKSFSKEYRNNLKEKLSNLCIIGISFLINAILYYFCFLKGQYNSEVYVFMQFFWTQAEPGFFTLGNFLTLFPQRLYYLIEIANFPMNLLVPFLLLNIVLFIKSNFDLKTKFFVIIPILLSIIASFLNLYPFQRKFILFLLPLYTILYTQILYLIKPNKFFKILTILVIIYCSYMKFINPSLHPYYTTQPVRKMIEYIVQNKIPANKTIFASQEHVDYYLNSIYTLDEPLLHDIPWAGFETSKVPELLKQSPKGDYYIFTPFSNISDKYNKGLIKYLNEDKHLKILKTYSYFAYKEWVYIIHFEKK